MLYIFAAHCLLIPLDVLSWAFDWHCICFINNLSGSLQKDKYLSPLSNVMGAQLFVSQLHRAQAESNSIRPQQLPSWMKTRERSIDMTVLLLRYCYCTFTPFRNQGFCIYKQTRINSEPSMNPTTASTGLFLSVTCGSIEYRLKFIKISDQQRIPGFSNATQGTAGPPSSRRVRMKPGIGRLTTLRNINVIRPWNGSKSWHKRESVSIARRRQLQLTARRPCSVWRDVGEHERKVSRNSIESTTRTRSLEYWRDWGPFRSFLHSVAPDPGGNCSCGVIDRTLRDAVVVNFLTRQRAFPRQPRSSMASASPVPKFMTSWQMC